ncbi:flagellar export protein FliJ [Buchnera aphidicola]|nr:flagellar FliJ family protein [Buchnera aphidicola]
MKIQNIYLKKNKTLNQLEILTSYKKEYIKKMHAEMISGISVHCLINYQSFIVMLDHIIQENLCVIENDTKIIKESIENLTKNHINLKTWTYLNAINKQRILKIKTIKEQSINDNYTQLKFLKKDAYFNVGNNESHNISEQYD